MKRILKERCGVCRTALSFTLSILKLLGAIVPTAAAAEAQPGGSAAEVVSVALSQLDYAEKHLYTKYGDWYGFPKGAWCDMFVSWCAKEAGVPKEVFPRSASCTQHIGSFVEQGRYHVSAARGGRYTPQQGDLIFFYNPKRYPSGSVAMHVGLVLCCEDGYVFTVEGNTITNRLDYDYLGEVLPSRILSRECADYVCVKRYALSERMIHGYASPDYADRTPLAHTGFVDLGKYAGSAEAFASLNQRGIMPGTSSYTFSPRYGMTRAEFADAAAKLFDLPAAPEGTASFGDLTASHAHYDGVMAARAAGLVTADANGRFRPNLYISGAEAQEILSKGLTYSGKPDRRFTFRGGDLSYILTPYAIRADLAAALYEIDPVPYVPPVSEPERLSLQAMWNGQPMSWRLMSLGEASYAALADLLRLFPELSEVPEELESADIGDAAPDAAQMETPTAQPDTAQAAPSDDAVTKAETPAEQIPAEGAEQTAADTPSETSAETIESSPEETAAPNAETDENVFCLSSLTLRRGETETSAACFTLDGVRYVDLADALRLVNMQAVRNSAAGTLELLPAEPADAAVPAADQAS